jgi:hypothetical protein
MPPTCRSPADLPALPGGKDLRRLAEGSATHGSAAMKPERASETSGDLLRLALLLRSPAWPLATAQACRR